MDDAPDDPPLHPFELRVDVLDRMVNVELADDPTYTALEMQWFDDPVHGRGPAVLLTRRDDGRTDVLVEPGLRLDRTGYEIGAGLGAWVETRFRTAHLAVEAAGVRAALDVTDGEGRRIELVIADDTARGRRTAGFLAPMGAAVTTPRSLPLVWMSRFELLRRSGPPPVVRVDGRDVAIGRLPAEQLLGRRLVKVASDLCAVMVNPVADAPVPLPASGAGSVTHGDARGTTAVVAAAAGHDVRLVLDPAFPDLRDPVLAVTDGGWAAVVDGTSVASGTWRVHRDGATRRVDLDVTRGWPARGLPPLMTVVTRVAPVFRTWPTTYRWTATVTDDDPPLMTSSWCRTGTERGRSYRTLTRSA